MEVLEREVEKFLGVSEDEKEKEIKGFNPKLAPKTMALRKFLAAITGNTVDTRVYAVKFGWTEKVIEKRLDALDTLTKKLGCTFANEIVEEIKTKLLQEKDITVNWKKYFEKFSPEFRKATLIKLGFEKELVDEVIK